MQSCVSAKTLKQQSLGLDPELDPAKQLSGGSAPVLLLGVVQEPGLVIELPLGQEPEEGARLLDVGGALAHQASDQGGVGLVLVRGNLFGVSVHLLEDVTVVLVHHLLVVHRGLYLGRVTRVTLLQDLFSR